MLYLLKKRVTKLTKKEVLTSKKVTPSEEVEKGTKHLDDMKEEMITIRRKDFNNFEGQSIGSACWFNIDNEF